MINAGQRGSLTLSRQQAVTQLAQPVGVCTCAMIFLLSGIMTNTVQGHTAPSSRPAARQLSFSDLPAALAAAIMAAWEPRKARPPCSLAALNTNMTCDNGRLTGAGCSALMRCAPKPAKHPAKTVPEQGQVQSALPGQLAQKACLQIASSQATERA